MFSADEGLIPRFKSDDTSFERRDEGKMKVLSGTQNGLQSRRHEVLLCCPLQSAISQEGYTAYCWAKNESASRSDGEQTDPSAGLTVRIGTGEAREERWGVSTDRNATFSPNWAGNLLKEILDVLKEILDEDGLVLQTIPYGEHPVTAILDVSGVRGPLGELAETCNWSL
jgi:hypothetical protein